MNKSAFSLVELSIVLVILGLLVGGIMTGQNLIKAAELRAVATEYDRWQTAIHLFRDKYMSMPGDMTNATSFWGDNAAQCADAAIPDGATCNGDGDGWLQEAAAASQEGEIFLFWQHLALAGLIQGEYTGLAGPGGSDDSLVTTNVPATKFGNGGWSIDEIDPPYSGTTVKYARQDYGNHFLLGAKSTNKDTDSPLFTPEDAWNIDTKIDDGKPALGNVIAMYWNDACAAADDGTHANNDFIASYKLSDSSVQCALIFMDVAK